MLLGDGFGSLFMSDSTGARYSLSLDNHLVRDATPGSGYKQGFVTVVC